jgi:hypothetical protein
MAAMYGKWVTFNKTMRARRTLSDDTTSLNGRKQNSGNKFYSPSVSDPPIAASSHTTSLGTSHIAQSASGITPILPPGRQTQHSLPEGMGVNHAPGSRQQGGRRRSAAVLRRRLLRQTHLRRSCLRKEGNLTNGGMKYVRRFDVEASRT